jgi:putative DNA primase/helicase
MCRCPAHDDRTPSLHISEKAGQLLWHCHGPCSQERVQEALVSKGLLSAKQLTKETAVREPQSHDEQEGYHKLKQQVAPILRAAAYANAGAPVKYLKSRGLELIPETAMFLPLEWSRKLRKQIPGFKPYPAMVSPIIGQGRLQGVLVTYLTPDGTENLRDKSGKSIRRIYGARKGGYVLLGVIDHDNPPERFVVSEGIEKALAASQLMNCPAIAVPGGNFIDIDPPTASEHVIAADNDNNGGGQDKAKKAAAAWSKKGHKVRVAIPPNHKDWDDELRNPDADPDELRRLLLNSELIGPDEYQVRALKMGDLIDRTFPPRECFLKPILATGSLAMLHAQRGAGKTRFALSMAYAVASRQGFLRWPCERSGRVLYVDGELPATLLQERAKVLGPETPNLLLLSRDVLMRDARLTIPDLAQPEGRKFLDEIIDREKIDLIFLDSLSTLIRSGIENDAESWTPVQDWLLQHRFNGRTVVLIHHEGRSNRPRGTSKREDVLDTIMGLKLKDETSGNDAATFELHFNKSREFYGIDAAPLLVQLSTKSGCAEWTSKLQHDRNRELAKQMQEDGFTQNEIAAELGVSQPRVSQMLKHKA